MTKSPPQFKMKTFQDILKSVNPSEYCRLFVEYPDGTIRTQILKNNPDIAWIDATKCEGMRIRVSDSIYTDIVYKWGEWVPVEK